MKDKYKRTILRLELEVEASGKELELLKTRVETDSAKLAVAEAEFTMESHLLMKSREVVSKLEADLVKFREAIGAAAGEIVDLRHSFLEAQREAEQAISERDEVKEDLGVAQEATTHAEADAEDARSERDGVQTENEELRQTISRQQEDWRRERGTLEFRVSEAESQLHAARASGF